MIGNCLVIQQESMWLFPVRKCPKFSGSNVSLLRNSLLYLSNVVVNWTLLTEIAVGSYSLFSAIFWTKCLIALIGVNSVCCFYSFQEMTMKHYWQTRMEKHVSISHFCVTCGEALMILQACCCKIHFWMLFRQQCCCTRMPCVPIHLSVPFPVSTLSFDSYMMG